MFARKLWLALVVAGIVHAPTTAQTPAQTPAATRSVALDLETADDEAAQHESRWMRTIDAALIAENFDDLDRMADQYRRNKTLLPGGDWRLRYFYTALDRPQLTEKDTVDHLDHLRHWVAQRPESITARVALATSLHRWAWVARGNGLARTVTEEGWTLFNERIAEASTVLQAATTMKTMCPQWYLEEMTVGLAQGWDGKRMQEVFNRAIQFEPDYQYFYTARANYLLPKWYGQTDEASSFAKDAADRQGGDAGDIIYFQVGTVIIRRGNGELAPFVKAMDWQRLQRGYAALVAKAGVSRKTENALAFMAYKYKDPTVARQQFATIGDDWAPGVWKQRIFFDRVRDWSNGHTAWP